MTVRDYGESDWSVPLKSPGSSATSFERAHMGPIPDVRAAACATRSVWRPNAITRTVLPARHSAIASA